MADQTARAIALKALSLGTLGVPGPKGDKGDIGPKGDSGTVSVDKQTLNLYDKTQKIVGSYHNHIDGTIVVNAGSMETHRITVKPRYNYVLNSGGGGVNFSFYDTSEAFISGGTSNKAKAPANAKYLYVRLINTTIADTLMVMETTYIFADYVPYTQKYIPSEPVQGWFRSKWYEKTWWVLGDSISTGYGDGTDAIGGVNPFANKPYHYLIARERGINVQNEAVSGYSIGSLYDNKVVNMPPTAYAPDLITIMAGTNDHGFSTALGTSADDPIAGATFYARYRKTIEYLQSTYPYASIGLITPIQRNGSTIGTVANLAGKTLRDYCDAIIALGKYYSIQVLDWHYEIGITPYNPTHKTIYYVAGDGTHPNDAGQLKMAGLVGAFIEKL